MTFTKLQNGEWGVRGRGLVAGQTVFVTKRDGTSKEETIGQVVATFGDGVQLATIARRGRAVAERTIAAPVQAAPAVSTEAVQAASTALFEAFLKGVRDFQAVVEDLAMRQVSPSATERAAGSLRDLVARLEAQANAGGETK